jgi:outer membrane protein assembly factor BamE (lipoprotein component of BamABCDE complex)
MFVREMSFMKTLLQMSVLAAMLVSSCATDPDVPNLYAGMSRDRLKARFGEPIRIEHPRGGGEDWYYSFTSPPQFQGASSHDVQTQNDSVSVGISEGTGTQARPIHLSPDGFVTEPLPRGHLVK